MNYGICDTHNDYYSTDGTASSYDNYYRISDIYDYEEWEPEEDFYFHIHFFKEDLKLYCIFMNSKIRHFIKISIQKFIFTRKLFSENIGSKNFHK